MQAVFFAKFFFSFLFFSIFTLGFLWYHLFFENADVPCIISTACKHIWGCPCGVTGRKDRMNKWKCAICQKFNPADRNPDSLAEPLSDALNLTTPHLIWFWQQKEYLPCTEVPRKTKGPSVLLPGFSFAFSLLPSAKVICHACPLSSAVFQRVEISILWAFQNACKKQSYHFLWSAKIPCYPK